LAGKAICADEKGQNISFKLIGNVSAASGLPGRAPTPDEFASRARTLPLPAPAEQTDCTEAGGEERKSDARVRADKVTRAIGLLLVAAGLFAGIYVNQVFSGEWGLQI